MEGKIDLMIERNKLVFDQITVVNSNITILSNKIDSIQKNCDRIVTELEIAKDSIKEILSHSKY